VSWSFIQFTLLYLVIGSLIGSLITVLVLRKMIKSRIKGYYRLINDISLGSNRIRREYEKKLELLRHIADVAGPFHESGMNSEPEIPAGEKDEYRQYMAELAGLLKTCKIDFPVAKSK
jgi:hypothetical protein